MYMCSLHWSRLELMKTLACEMHSLPSLLLLLYPHSLSAYFRLCSEWLAFRPFATSSAPLSPMELYMRLQNVD